MNNDKQLEKAAILWNGRPVDDGTWVLADELENQGGNVEKLPLKQDQREWLYQGSLVDLKNGIYPVSVANEDESREVQEAVFAQGGKWASGDQQITLTTEEILCVKDGIIKTPGDSCNNCLYRDNCPSANKIIPADVFLSRLPPVESKQEHPPIDIRALQDGGFYVNDKVAEKALREMAQEKPNSAAEMRENFRKAYECTPPPHQFRPGDLARIKKSGMIITVGKVDKSGILYLCPVNGSSEYMAFSGLSPVRPGEVCHGGIACKGATDYFGNHGGIGFSSEDRDKKWQYCFFCGQNIAGQDLQPFEG